MIRQGLLSEGTLHTETLVVFPHYKTPNHKGIPRLRSRADICVPTAGPLPVFTLACVDLVHYLYPI